VIAQITVMQEIILIMLLFAGLGGAFLIPAAVDIREERTRDH
jgi:hypothetical protein